MKRILSVFLSLALITVIFSGCSSEHAIRVLSVENSPAATLSHMLAENTSSENNYVSSTVNIANMVQNIILEDGCDVAIVPVETAQFIHLRGLSSIQVLAGISTGGFELITSENITDISAVKGKEISLIERGTTMEGIFKDILARNGLNPNKDVTINYASDTKQLSRYFSEERISYALLKSEDAAVIKAENKGINSLNLTDELAKKFKNPSIVTYCVIATTDFIESNRDAIDTMITDIENSVTTALDDENTYTLAKELGLITKDIDVKALLKEYKPDFISGKAMQKKFTAYFNFLEKIGIISNGDLIPKDSFYYISE